MGQPVAIIGGGLAGLRAALELRRLGVASDLFEARDRLGGRAHSMKIDGRVLELGGTFIDAIDADLLALAEHYGLPVQQNYPDGTYSAPIRFALRDGSYSQSEFNHDALPLIAALRRDADSVADLADVAATQYLGQLSLTPAFREALEVLWHGEFGSDLAESSAATLFELALEELTADQVGLFEEGYVKYCLVGGTAELVSAIAKESGATIELEHILKAIRTDPNGVTLEFDTPSGPKTKRYDRAIVALPAAVLRDLNLAPLELPEELMSLIREIPIGSNEKLILHSSKRLDRMDQAVFDSTMRGLLWAKPCEAGCVISILHRTLDLADRPEFPDRLCTALPELADAEIRVLMETDWVGSQFSRGSYTCFGGGPATRPALKRYQTEPPINRFGNLILAGEYLSPDYRVQSHMEGALLSGIRAARVITSK